MKLEVDSVYFEARGRKILSGAYIKVNQGEIVGLLGRNGSGKTTLYKLIFGLYSNDNISKRVNGRYYKSLTDTGLLQFQTEQPSMPGHLTVKEAMELFLKDSALVAKLINQVEESEHQRLRALSQGKRKYLESLILLNSLAPFLIMDEPFNGLSPLMTERLMEEITRAKKHKGIIITDHRFNEVAAVADRLELMHSGTLLAIQGRDDLVRLGYLRH